MDLAVPPEHVAAVGDVVEHRARNHVAGIPDLVHPEREGHHDPEVPAAPAEGPEQVGLGCLAGRHQPAVREHDVGRHQVVDRKSETSGDVADAAAQSQAADPSGADDPARHRHAERHGRVVDVRPLAATVDPDEVLVRLDRRRAHRTEVDHERIVGNPEPAGVVSAASDCQVDAVLAGEAHARDHVSGVGAAGDSRRPLVDHRVVDGAGAVVVLVAGPDELAVQGLGEVGVRRGAALPGYGGRP